ncbi:hypothetical protein, partial [Photobacterium damselae]|uniref:hypothetical protein n=1 Tax=Photobacterium damselae TaxID=38293 RepID=UPI001EFCF2AF
NIAFSIINSLNKYSILNNQQLKQLRQINIIKIENIPFKNTNLYQIILNKDIKNTIQNEIYKKLQLK